MITNSLMRGLIPSRKPLGVRQILPDDVLAIVDAGWSVGPSGALLLTALSGEGRGAAVAMSDLGEYEYHVNDVHISLSDLRADMDSYLTNAAVRGIQFAVKLLGMAAGLPNGNTLCAIVSVFVDDKDEDFFLQGTTVRFSTRRGGYPEWLDDLEGFELDAIAVLEMTDAAPR